MGRAPQPTIRTTPAVKRRDLCAEQPSFPVVEELRQRQRRDVTKNRIVAAEKRRDQRVDLVRRQQRVAGGEAQRGREELFQRTVHGGFVDTGIAFDDKRQPGAAAASIARRSRSTVAGHPQAGVVEQAQPRDFDPRKLRREPRMRVSRLGGVGQHSTVAHHARFKPRAADIAGESGHVRAVLDCEGRHGCAIA